MEIDPSPKIATQPSLFDLDDTSRGVIEFFPAVWNAAEDLINPDPLKRRLAIEKLEEMRAARFSPVVAYLIATRIADPDVEVRMRVVRALEAILLPDEQGGITSDDVRTHLAYFLAHMRTRQIFAILQVCVTYPDLLPAGVRLLGQCPHAGNHLVDIATSRKVSLEIRRMAIRLVGEIGFLDAIPALERMQARMEARFNGQQAMPFAPPIGVEDSSLLPDIRSALIALRSP